MTIQFDYMDIRTIYSWDRIKEDQDTVWFTTRRGDIEYRAPGYTCAAEEGDT